MEVEELAWWRQLARVDAGGQLGRLLLRLRLSLLVLDVEVVLVGLMGGGRGGVGRRSVGRGGGGLRDGVFAKPPSQP